MTRTPAATASSTKLPPMKPAPPVTSQTGMWGNPPGNAAATALGRSERDVVVREAAVVELRAGRRTTGRTAHGGTGTLALAARSGGVAPAALVVTTAAATAGARPTLAATAQHLHLAGDDVGGVALDAVLAGVLVGAQRTFDVDLAAL